MKSLSLLVALAIAAPMGADCPSVQWTRESTESLVTDGVWKMVPIDYDEDGKMDVAYVQGSSIAGVLYTRRGLGNGTFEAPIQRATNASMQLTAADLTGNGRVDLVYISDGTTLVILPGTGTGFGTATKQTLSIYASRAIVGNFDGDALLEVVAISGHEYAVYDNTGGGNLVEIDRADTGGEFSWEVVAADFDDDGHLDVAVSQTGPDQVVVYFGIPDGASSPTVGLLATGRPMFMDVGDLEGDGDPDLVVGSETGEVTVYRYAGARFFNREVMFAPPPRQGGGPAVPLLRDISGDGKLDLLTSLWNSSWWMTTWINAGNNSFLTPSWTGGEGRVAYALADFDNDGRLDAYTAPYQKFELFSSGCSTNVHARARGPLITLGQDATLLANISGFPTTPPPPMVRGTVTFFKGDQIAGTVEVSSGGTASLTVPGLQLGQHHFSATYSGTPELPAGSSEEFTVDVTTDTSTTEIFPLGDEPVPGVDWPIQIVVTSSFIGPSYEYVLLDVDGTVTRHFTSEPVVLHLAAGQHTVKAYFEGTDFIPPSESETLVVDVQKLTPTMSRTGALAVRNGTAHALQFNVSGPPGKPLPSGTVTLFEYDAQIATIAIVNGVGTLNRTFTRGAHDLRATYSGNNVYKSVSRTYTVQVLPSFPLTIEARGLPSAMHIAYVLPDGIDGSSLELYRRPAGATDWQWLSAWSPGNGLDTSGLTRGVVYQYRLDAAFTSGTPISSNIDSGMLFTDDTLTAGTKIKRAHFDELRLAVNELRGAASLPPFNFPLPYATSPFVRAAHLTSLRTAVNEARAALGMGTDVFAPVAAGVTKIQAAHVTQLRNLTR